MRLDIVAGGLARPNTGIGIVQRNLFRRLVDDGDRMVLTAERDHERGGIVAASLGLARGWRPPKTRGHAYLAAIPPLPFLLRGPVVALVYDLRWLETRGRLGRAYRAWDLRRTVRRADVLLCISDHTRRGLEEFSPTSARKARTVHLGPGIADPGIDQPRTPGATLLVGGAPHKENERAARLLARARPEWCTSIIGVNVSDEVRATCEQAFGASRCDWRVRLSDERMARVYREAEYFVFLGTNEGFGMPYIEAAVSGATVVAVDQPLTQELLGRAAHLLPRVDDDVLVEQLRPRPSVDASATRDVADRYSWDRFATEVRKALLEVASAEEVDSRASSF